MSMLSVQCDKLRAVAESVGLAVPQAATLMMEAADIIWELRDSLDLALDSKRIAEHRVTELLDENAKLHEARGTCHVECYDDGIDEGLDGEWYSYVLPTWYLSCEHEAYGVECPSFCPVCGRQIVDEEESE